MNFSDKLKQAMQDLNLNQRQVCGMTGKSKSSVSQYLHGKQVPSQEVQRDIAVSLGLAPDFFEKETVAAVKPLKKTSGVIPQIRVRDAAKLMRMNHSNVAKGLQQGVFGWGYAVRTSTPDAEKATYTYFINASRFAEIEGVEVPAEMVM